MNIYGSHLVQGTQSINAPMQAEKLSNNKEVESKTQTPVKDEIEISLSAHEVNENRGVGLAFDASDVRFDRVNEARAKIASGVYDDPKYLEAALEKMLASF